MSALLVTEFCFYSHLKAEWLCMQVMTCGMTLISVFSQSEHIILSFENPELFCHCPTWITFLWISLKTVTFTLAGSLCVLKWKSATLSKYIVNYVHLLSTHAQLLTNANHKAATQFICIYECGKNNLLKLKTKGIHTVQYGSNRINHQVTYLQIYSKWVHRDFCTEPPDFPFDWNVGTSQLFTYPVL